MSISKERRQNRRKVLKGLLENRDFEGITVWSRQQPNPASAIFSLLFDEDVLLRWRAVEALGVVAKDLEGDAEKVRNMLRRLFWQMNDESGGVIWNAPEAIGEILFKVPKLIPEFGNPLVSHLQLSPFEIGVHWSAARLAPIAPDLLANWARLFEISLVSEIPDLRGLAGAALKDVDISSIRQRIESLSEDRETVRVYDTAIGDFVERSVGQLMQGL